MILNLPGFIEQERPYWDELEERLKWLEEHPEEQLPLAEVQRFHYLFERAAADLARLTTFASERELQAYLENLVARAYAETHESRRLSGVTLSAGMRYITQTFPATFRRHQKAFAVSVIATIVGVVFGALVVTLDPAKKPAIIPAQFSHVYGDPSERVAMEEQRAASDEGSGGHTQFSAMLMTHNTRVSINVLALGMTFGIGALIMLFYNGVILGAVAIDYVWAGETPFLLGWLLPHGVVEIPAILIAGQAAMVLASALIGWGNRLPLRRRLRDVAPDLMALIAGIAAMLVWAGLVEAFFSQYHEPIIPYAVKILFGCIELALLIWFLYRPKLGRDSAAVTDNEAAEPEVKVAAAR
jgi:uncharacterized membrane protein SpoIIM required for sporulation